MLSLALLLLAQLALAALTPEAVRPGKVLVYQYWTDAYCNSIWGASTYMRVGTYSGTCLCLKGEESQFLCPSASKGSDQAYCLQTKQTTLGDTSDPDPSPELARCDICSRTAGSPGTRSVPCQDSLLLGKVISSGACGSGRSLYQLTEGDCRCELTGKAPSNAKKCPLPKAGGYATCRDSVEYWLKSTLQGPDPVSDNYRGLQNKCEMKCNTGLHLSPSERPVTCCKAGYRASAAGVCAKSTDGKQ